MPGTGSDVEAITPHLLRRRPPPEPAGDSKDGRGRVLVVAGSVGVPGAALLAGTASLRVGAGKLQLAVPREIAVPLGIAMPEALVMGLDQTEKGGIAAGSGAEIAPRAARVDAVLTGPGMVEEDATREAVARVLTDAREVAHCIDAGALSGLADAPDLTRGLAAPPVLTPHAGEMAGLLGLSREAVEADPLAAAREAADRFCAVAVMKGGVTYVAEPGGRAWCYEAGRVGLATSGSGDTLAGFIAGLLARGAAPADAALWGVYVHGEAGRRLGRRLGRVGFLAREIPDEAPTIVMEILE